MRHSIDALGASVVPPCLGPSPWPRRDGAVEWASGDPQLRHRDMAHPEQPGNRACALAVSQAPGRLFALVIVERWRAAAVDPARLGVFEAVLGSLQDSARMPLPMVVDRSRNCRSSALMVPPRTCTRSTSGYQSLTSLPSARSLSA